MSIHRTIIKGLFVAVAIVLFNHASLAFELPNVSLPGINFTLNGKKVDLFGKSGSSQKKTTSSKKMGSRSEKAPPKSHLSTSLASRVADRGPQGPDVIGLRVGMNVEDVRAIIQSRKYYKPKEQYKYSLISSSSDGKFFTQLKEPSIKQITSGIANSNKNDSIFVIFTPNPKGRERISGVGRTTSLTKNKPTIKAFKRSIFKKYGQPTFTYGRNDRLGFGWVFDRNGDLQKAGLYSAQKYSNCEPSRSYGPSQGRNGTSIAVHKVTGDTLKSIELGHRRVTPQCGSITLTIFVHVSNMTVDVYFTNLQGYDEFFGATLAAKKRALINADAVYQKNIANADTIDPDL